jgi:hypothetical protein
VYVLVKALAEDWHIHACCPQLINFNFSYFAYF